ncbi:MAG TPA: prolipoprotein diacylglyceryl transferase family protein [Gemmatimonadaceae bacterium]
MHPIAFQIAGHPVRSQGLLYVLAVIVAGVYAYRVARRNGWDSERVLPGLALVVAAAYLGARLHGALNNWQVVVADPVRGLLHPGDLSFFGGLASGSAVLVAFLWRARLPMGAVADALSPIAPVIYAVFRLGCFLNGDDYGSPTELPWGMSFPEGSPPTTERVHPTQLYEMLLMAPVFLWLRSRIRSDHSAGSVAFELCILMGAERIAVEVWRSGFGRSGPGHLVTSQWLALVLAAVGVAGRWWLSKRPADDRRRAGPGL